MQNPDHFPQPLKQDLFGRVDLVPEPGGRLRVRRDTRHARWWLRWLARRLAAREAQALAILGESPQWPELQSWQAGVLERSWLGGRPMQLARPRRPQYFREALRLLRRLHRAGIAHNDLAKEPNWLVLDDGRPAIVDFQLASYSPRRGHWFRLLAREDLRHLLKHKRTYCPAALTSRQQAMLAAPAMHTRLWMASGKRLYRLITRRWLGWADREGASDRQFRD